MKETVAHLSADDMVSIRCVTAPHAGRISSPTGFYDDRVLRGRRIAKPIRKAMAEGTSIRG